jgi:hypothetical protein
MAHVVMSTGESWKKLVYMPVIVRRGALFPCFHSSTVCLVSNQMCPHLNEQLVPRCVQNFVFEITKNTLDARSVEVQSVSPTKRLQIAGHRLSAMCSFVESSPQSVPKLQCRAANPTNRAHVQFKQESENML